MTLVQKYGLGIKTEIEYTPVTDFGSAQIIMDKDEEIVIGNKAEKSMLEKTNELDEIHFKYEDTKTITIPENHQSKKPLIIKLNLITNTCTHFQFFAGKNSETEVIIDISSTDEVTFTSLFVEIFAEPGSKISYNELNNLNKGIFYTKRRGKAEEDSQINWLTCDIGGETIISEIHTFLNGKNSVTKTNNVYYSENQKIDIKSVAEHNNSGTKSDLKAKGVVKKSEAFFRGLVQINENAPDSNGYQKSDALILDDSRVVAIPDLLIHNDKVKCSHGSAISRIDVNKLFYMQSRGLTKKDAELEMIQGFIEPELNLSPDIMPRFLGVVMEKVRKSE